VDHDHGPEASISEEADPLYRPLEACGPSPVDEAAWAAAVARLEAIRRDDPEWADVVGRGAMLAAAYQSGALDGVHAGSRDVALALLRGEASAASMDEAVRAHVRANLDALELARDAGISEDTIRGVHEAACRPQLSHRVLVDGRVQDHVMAPGDYKHHPNHLRTVDGWLATAPVAQVPREMARAVEVARQLAEHPLQQAGWLHHALLHVRPFADGNGRVARALAGGSLLRAAAIPLLTFDDHLDPIEAVEGLVDLMATADRSALASWRERSAAAAELRRRVVPALERSLRRDDPARRADVSGATIGADLVVRVPGVEVEEVLVFDAHPLDDGPVNVTAREAALRLVAGDEVEPWADRVAAVPGPPGGRRTGIEPVVR
jgi:hypothetical protein